MCGSIDQLCRLRVSVAHPPRPLVDACAHAFTWEELNRAAEGGAIGAPGRSMTAPVRQARPKQGAAPPPAEQRQRRTKNMADAPVMFSPSTVTLARARTATGVLLLPVLPFPNCPDALPPHATTPALVRA